jgi:hypothetical protein
VQFPVIVTVPLDRLATPLEAPKPPWYRTFDTTAHDCPVVRLDEKTIELGAPTTTPVPVQVNVIPLAGTNDPPATIGDAAPFLMLNTVGDVSIVTV